MMKGERKSGVVSPFFIYNYHSTQTYTKLNIYNHQIPKYSNSIWEYEKYIHTYIHRYISYMIFILG